MGYQNFFATKLYTDVGAADTVIALETVPTVTSGRLVLEARNPTQREIIKYTGVAGNTITGVTRGHGGTTAKSHLKNALVEMNATAGDLEDLYDAFNTFAASNGSGWLSLAQVPVLTATNGNRSFNLSIPTDLTSVLSKGMRLKIPRTGTTPTQSADFNGTTQYASKSSPTGITFTDDYTVEGWVYLDSYKKGFILSRFNNSVTTGWGVNVEADGKIRSVQITTATEIIITNQSIPLKKWTHLAWTTDLSGNTSAIYIDGVLVASSISGTATATSQTGDLVLGAGATGVDAFDGKIADVRLWSTVRTQAQIRDNMNQQLTGSETGLIGYWKLDGNFNDSTANANNLTPAGSAVATASDNPFNANAYAIIMTKPVHSGGNTTMTVQTPIGYPIPNATLGTVSYSSVKAPFGFPADKDAWSLFALNIGTQTLSITSNFQPLNANILCPVGDWEIEFGVTTAVEMASTAARAIITGVSTITTNVDLPGLASYVGIDGDSATTVTSYFDQSVENFYRADTQITLYLITQIGSTASLTGFTTRSAFQYPTFIKMTNQLL